MEAMNKKGQTILVYRILVAVIGVGLLVYTSLRFPLAFEGTWEAVLVAFFAAFLVGFPLQLFGFNFSAIHLVALTSGMLYGAAFTGLAVFAGMLIGFVFWGLAYHWRISKTIPPVPPISEIAFRIGLQLVPLMAVALVSNWQQAISSDPVLLQDVWWLIWVALGYAAIHAVLLLVDFWLRSPVTMEAPGRDVFLFVLIEFLLLPFVILVVQAFIAIQIGAIALLGAIIGISSISIHLAANARSDLLRRVQDISTLQEISLTMRSTLDVDELLEVIHVQITELLKADSFYVALYDERDDRLWYPLAVKRGKRHQWPRRPLMDRLTDRVIREQQAFMLPRNAYQEIERIGLPRGEELLQTWLGVPLATPKRVLGCLAVFSFTQEVEFTPADRNMLTILSSQVSVALENALLYEQTQQRASQLESLNKIAAQISASLEPEAVLEEVCKAVFAVSQEHRCAIFLTEPDDDHVCLAHASGLSDHFTEQTLSFPVSYDGRTRSLRTGRPELYSSLDSVDLENSYKEHLIAENIQAFGEFPMGTPDGYIGFLSVFYDEPHDFQEEEVDLLKTLASQAGLAVSNARLHASTDQALSQRAQQLTILETVGRQLSAAFHSERLFEMILEYALDFTDSPCGGLTIWNKVKGAYELKASKGYVSPQKFFDESEGIAGRVIREKQPAVIEDVRQDPDYIDLTQGITLSQLTVPLIHEERVLGVLNLENSTPKAFTESDLAFINQLANQAAVAVVNAELYTDAQRWLHDQSSMYLVGTRLVSDLSLKNVLDTVVQAVRASINSFLAGVYLRQENGHMYQLMSTSETLDNPGITLPATLLDSDLVVVREQPSDTRPLYVDLEELELRSDLELSQECQVCLFPLLAAKKRLGVVLAALPGDLMIGERDLQLPKAVTSQGAIALQNSLLFSDVTQGRDRLETVLNSVGEVVLLLEGNGRLTLANKPLENLSDQPVREMVGKGISDLPKKTLQVLGYSRAEAKELEQLLQAGGGPKPKSTYNVADKFLERDVSPVMGAGQNVIGWLIVIRDVTEEYHINQTRELITDTLIHDLRAPVGAVTSALMLMDEVLPVEERDPLIQQSLEIAQRSTRRVLTLIESLLDISHFESGGIELKLETINLNALATETVAEFIPQAVEAGIIMRTEIEVSLLQVQGDRTLIQRVLVNLLDNALKYTPEGGQISVSGEPLHEDSVLLCVSDTGPGVPDDYREEIFQRFAQVPGSQGRRRGSGLGLTFCRLAVEAHGGKIWVEPRPGGGSRFVFRLPIAGPVEAEPDEVLEDAVEE